MAFLHAGWTAANMRVSEPRPSQYDTNISNGEPTSTLETAITVTGYILIWPSLIAGAVLGGPVGIGISGGCIFGAAIVGSAVKAYNS